MRATAQPRPFTLSTTHKQLCAWLSTPRAHQAGSRQGQHCQTARTVAMAAVAEPETASSRLEDLSWEHQYVEALPGDSSRKPGRRQVHGAFHSLVDPTPTLTKPYLVAASDGMATTLGLSPQQLRRQEFAEVFSGNGALPAIEGKTWAHCYGGHQFGMWAGQLGDGRAISLGELVDPAGKRWELQLKGAGPTPYSRTADGRAVLRSSIREFIASEAMHALGIPTTRALSLVGTGAQVMRDMFYNGNVKMEPGAVVCRVSQSFVRFGTFQLPASRGGEEVALVRQLADYIIKHNYPHLDGGPNKYVALLREVSQRTGKLFAQWQAFGFVHGVLNTDNMSILGETIDYGPFGFLERFDPDYTPNTTDMDGMRYTYGRQPTIGQWNLAQLAQALLLAELIEQQEATEAVGTYARVLKEEHNILIGRKMGLREYNQDLSVGLLTNMYKDKTDFTTTFRSLASVSADDGAGSIPAPLAKAIGDLDSERHQAWEAFLTAYRAKLKEEGLSTPERQASMNAINPLYIPRNQVLQEVIKSAEAGDYGPVQHLAQTLQNPFTEQPGAEHYVVTPPQRIRMGVEMLSCSS